MIIVGAKGFAKEVLEIFAQHQNLDNLYFFDNISVDLPDKLFNKFPILTSVNKVAQVFEQTNDNRFTLGLGGPIHRSNLTKLFEEAGGVLTSAVSRNANIGSFGNVIGEGCSILDNTVITNSVSIGKGCLINSACSISHDAYIGDFVEMGAGVRINGFSRVGSFSVLETNAIVLPNVSIGQNVIVGAGTVVIKNIPDNSLVLGVPAIVKKELLPMIH